MENAAYILLKEITDTSKDGSAVILDKAELLTKFPKRLAVDGARLDQLIKELSLSDFIKVSFSDESMICAAPLPKGQLISTEAKEIDSGAKIISKSRGGRGKLAFTVFAAAFAGAFLACILAYFVLQWLS